MNQNENLNNGNGEQIFPDFSVAEESEEVSLDSYDYPVVFKTLNTFFGECNGTVIGTLSSIINDFGLLAQWSNFAWEFLTSGPSCTPPNFSQARIFLTILAF